MKRRRLFRGAVSDYLSRNIIHPRRSCFIHTESQRISEPLYIRHQYFTSSASVNGGERGGSTGNAKGRDDGQVVDGRSSSRLIEAPRFDQFQRQAPDNRTNDDDGNRLRLRGNVITTRDRIPNRYRHEVRGHICDRRHISVNTMGEEWIFVLLSRNPV